MCGITIVLLAGVCPASAEPRPYRQKIADARRQVRERTHALATAKAGLTHARDRLDALNDRVESLIEAYNGEMVKLAAARARARQTAAQLQQAEARVSEAREMVTAYALESMAGIALPPEIEALTGTPGSALQRAALIDHLGGTQAAVLGNLEDAQEVAAILRVTAAEALADQRTAAERAREAKIRAQDAVAEQAAEIKRLRHRKDEVADRLADAVAYVDKLRQTRMGIEGSGAGAQAARWALSQVGKPYVWAAAGPYAYDCSGLTMRAWGEAGVALDHWTGTQWTSGPHVPISQLRAGDLLFFAYDPADPATIHHVGLYVGRGLMVHAPQTGDVVRVAPIDRPDLAGATRPQVPRDLA